MKKKSNYKQFYVNFKYFLMIILILFIYSRNKHKSRTIIENNLENILKNVRYKNTDYYKGLCSNKHKSRTIIENNLENILKNVRYKNTDYYKGLCSNIQKITDNYSKKYNFFELKNKISEDYLDFILYNYCKINRNLFFIIVWPVAHNFEKHIYDCYQEYGKIIYKKEISLNDNGVKNILKFISNKGKHPLGEKIWFAKPYRYSRPLTVYLFETKYSNESEKNKIDYLTKVFNNNSEHINNIKKTEGVNNLYCTTKAKRKCRKILEQHNCIADIKICQDKSYSHHVNDEHWETIELSRIFFNNNSLFAINNCDMEYNCESFNSKYLDYINFLKNNNYGDVEDFCLHNSSILSQFGIRNSRDIDYINNTYFKIPKQIPQEEISSNNYVISEYAPNIDINELIYNPQNYFWYKNIKFLTLNNLLKIKSLQRYKHFIGNNYNIKSIENKKCSLDCKRISDFLAEKVKNTEIKNNIELREYETYHTACHYRKLWKDNEYYYKVIIFDDSIDPIFKNNNFCNTLKKAIKNNFFQNVTIDVDIKYKENNIFFYKSKILNDVKKLDKNKLEDLINRLINNYNRTGIIYVDLDISNIKEYNNNYYIIDLESVTDYETYTSWNNNYPQYQWNINKDYFSKILNN